MWGTEESYIWVQKSALFQTRWPSLSLALHFLVLILAVLEQRCAYYPYLLLIISAPFPSFCDHITYCICTGSWCPQWRFTRYVHPPYPNNMHLLIFEIRNPWCTPQACMDCTIQIHTIRWHTNNTWWERWLGCWYAPPLPRHFHKPLLITSTTLSYIANEYTRWEHCRRHHWFRAVRW